MKPGDPNWPTLDNGQPVPPNRRDEPCGNCQRLDRPCTDHQDDAPPADTPQGRPPAYVNNDRRQDMLDAARLGTSWAGIARAGRVSTTTIYRWKTRGEDGPDADDPDRPWYEDFWSFWEHLVRARSQGEKRLVARVHEEDPKYLLGTSYGYVREEKRTLEHLGAGGGPVEVVFSEDLQADDPEDDEGD